MSREEAIEYWEGLRKTFSSQLEKEENHFGRMHLQTTIDAIDMAIFALRQQERFGEANKTLTLDELRQMDGEPVWCEIYIKGQSSFYGIVHGENVTGFIPGDDKPANLAITNVGAYGLAWLAYRQKPEEGLSLIHI